MTHTSNSPCHTCLCLQWHSWHKGLDAFACTATQSAQETVRCAHQRQLHTCTATIRAQLSQPRDHFINSMLNRWELRLIKLKRTSFWTPGFHFQAGKALYSPLSWKYPPLPDDPGCKGLQRPSVWHRHFPVEAEISFTNTCINLMCKTVPLKLTLHHRDYIWSKASVPDCSTETTPGWALREAVRWQHERFLHPKAAAMSSVETLAVSYLLRAGKEELIFLSPLFK